MKFYFGIILLFMSLNVFTQNFNQKIFPNDPKKGALFGKFVEINNPYLFISAYKDSENGSASGSIYVYKENNGIYNQVFKIFPSDGIEEQFFGYSIHSQGDWLISGAHHDSDFGASSGAAYMINKSNQNTWSIVQKLTPDDLSEADEFGKTVDIYNDYAVCCAYLDDDKGVNSGAVYIYKLDGEIWKKLVKLYASDAKEYSQFGLSLDLFEDQLIVGAPYKSDKALEGGSAYIYEKIDNKWVETKIIEPTDIEDNDNFGITVRITGNFAFISSINDDDKGTNSGSVYIYKKEIGTWEFFQKISAPDGFDYDGFGIALECNDSLLIVGSYFDDDKGTNSGSAYIYKNKDDQWVLYKKINASDGEESDAFGVSLSFDKNELIVGAFADSDKGFLSGSAYVFSFNNILSIKDNNWDSDKIIVYPSIFKDCLIIESGNDKTLIEVYDLKGHLILKRKLNQYQNKIETSAFNRGMNIIKVLSQKNIDYFKVFKR